MLERRMTGAILAEGPASFHLAELPAMRLFPGECMLNRQIKRMRGCCREMIVVANDPKPLLRAVDESVRLITDFYKECGVLGGIHAALHLSRNPVVWITANGMPYVSPGVAVRLLDQLDEHLDAVLPVIGGIPVPLHGVYSKSCSMAAAWLLDEGEERMDAFLDSIHWRGIPIDDWGDLDGGESFVFRIQIERRLQEGKCHLH